MLSALPIGAATLAQRLERAPVRLPLIEGKDIRFAHYSIEQGLSHNRFSGPIESRIYRTLAEDLDGSIWAGTFEWGLERLDVRTGKIVAYTEQCLAIIGHGILRFQPEVLPLGSLKRRRVSPLL